MVSAIILILTVLGFVFLGFVIYFKIRNPLPLGVRHTVCTLGNIKVHIILGTDCVFGRKDTFKRLLNAKAVAAAMEAWGTQRALPDFDQVCILVKDFKYMDARAKKWGYKYLAAFVESISVFFSKDIPCIIVNENELSDSDLDYGALIIHEMMHVLACDYTGDAQDHSDPEVWKTAGKKGSIQELAEDRYALL